MTERTLYTIGHANHTIDEFVGLLKSHGVTTLIDVRSFPGSRRSPQFGDGEMGVWLPNYDIEYLSARYIGGRRRAELNADDSNAGWENDSFRNYADFMNTALGEECFYLLSNYVADSRNPDKVAIMCGEPVPWRCHRSILADYFTIDGYRVEHIMPNGSLITNRLDKWGPTPYVSSYGKITYPKEEE